MGRLNEGMLGRREAETRRDHAGEYLDGFDEEIEEESKWLELE